MTKNKGTDNFLNDELIGFIPDKNLLSELVDAEKTLAGLADVFLPFETGKNSQFNLPENELPDLNSRYRVLVEGIPAIVFMSFLDRAIMKLIFHRRSKLCSVHQSEWLQDPVRWFEHLHDEDKYR